MTTLEEQLADTRRALTVITSAAERVVFGDSGEPLTAAEAERARVKLGEATTDAWLVLRPSEAVPLPEGNSHYLHVGDSASMRRPAVAHTLEMISGVNVDLDDDGCVLGVEAIGRRVTTEDLVRVLASCVIKPEGDRP